MEANEEKAIKDVLEHAEKAKKAMMDLMEPKEGILGPRLAEVLSQSFTVAAKTIETHG